jgi:uncharacterized protein (DUF1778 family)
VKPNTEDRVVPVRIRADDYVVIRGTALIEGKDVSTFIRDAALERALAELEDA